MNHQFINGIQDIAERYTHFIFDIFGVIHDGIEPFPDTISCMQRMKDAGKIICCLSNSPRRSSGAASQMHAMGITPDLYDHIVTSGEATYSYLKNRHAHPDITLGDDCWFIGNGLVDDVIEGQGLTMLDAPDHASFILNAIPGTQGNDAAYLKQQLKHAKDKGLPMICANPDLVVNIGQSQYECAGTFALYYEEIGGQVVYHGKPHSPVYEQAYEYLGRPDKSKICAVGDSFRTDIAGANHFGIDSVMNLVGIHWEEICMDHKPDQADMQKLDHVITQSKEKPTYTMAGLAW